MSKTEYHPFHTDMPIDEWWPYTAPNTAPLPSEGEWLLLMSKGGAVSLWHQDDDRPEGLLPVYRHDDEKTLRQALVMFCRRAHDSDPAYFRTDGTVFLLNWRSFTMAQLGVATRVFDLFVKGEVDEAWAVGREFEEQINAATNTFFQERRRTQQEQ